MLCRRSEVAAASLVEAQAVRTPLARSPRGCAVRGRHCRRREVRPVREHLV
jgi:hypothetical protein